MQKLTYAEARQIDLVDYLVSQGHHPTKIRNNDFWYLSPLRIEKTASFKVNRYKNVWYDHAIGKGGDILDFGFLYLKCYINKLLIRLSVTNIIQPLSTHKSSLLRTIATSIDGDKEAFMHKILITDTRPITSYYLLEYLESRCIPPGIADSFCKEVDFILSGRKHTAIGFPNDQGGYELRNRQFKGSSAPKTSTFIDNKSDKLLVFEGFFDFMSYHAICPEEDYIKADFLVLTLWLFLKSKKIRWKRINIFIFS
jgi:hypothetical protein